MTRPMSRLLVSLSSLLLFTGTTLTSQKTTSWKTGRFSEDAAAVYKAASAVTAKRGSEVLVLYDENTFTFDADGKSVETSYKVYKVLSEKGVNGWDSLSVIWEPWHEEKPSVRARVITIDRISHALDPKSITDSPASDGSEKEYGDRRVIRAPFPAIAPGAVVEEETTIRETAPLFAAGAVTGVYFGSSSPVQETQLFLDAPASLQLQYKALLLPQLNVERKEENGRVRVHFVQGPIDALENGESYLPSDQPVFPQVTFSTAPSWQKVAASYQRIVDEQIQKGNAGELAGQLTKGKNTPDEKLAAIVQYLSREVRYTGVEFDESSLVPHPPRETLKKRYGDCKDKSTLLVALARAAGIPAYVALLKVGRREDVQADLPGMGVFDHAIVYVPGNPARWIDATDEYARLGQIPAGDQGRLSLIARAESAALVRTPESESTENRLHETREIYLAENGPARVVEISEPSGVFESGYRAAYADKDNKDTRKNLIGYVKNEYLAEKLTKFERTDPKDLSQPFRMMLETTPAKRGVTELDDAVAAIRLESLFSNLPNELRQKEPEEKKKQGDENDAATKPRVGDYQLSEGYVTEWDYKIVPPPGFRSKPLPGKKTVSLGPAVFGQEFSADPDGTVHGRLTFDTVKRRLTLAESKEMRNKIGQLQEGPAILIFFEPVSSALMAEGKVRESFQSARDLIAAHPKQAVYHLRMAKALLAAGLGQAARDEARKAVELEPQSALAEKTLAEILEFDQVGRKMRRGSDFAGAEKAFRQAQALDSEDKTITANLAILLEFNNWGLRYGPGAKLREAVGEYGKLTAEERAGFGLQNNLAFALYYAQEFAGALKETQNLNPQPSALVIACETILNGSQAGLSAAKRQSADEEQTRDIERAAGDLLVNLRKYSLAADLVEAGASGEQASEIAANAALYRKSQPHEQMVFADDPAGTALRYALLEANPDLSVEQMRTVASRNGAVQLAAPSVVEELAKREQGTFSWKSHSGQFPDVGIDLSMARAEPRAEGNDQTGYKVTLWGSASYKTAVYVVKEGGKYKVLGTSNFPVGIGLEILDRVSVGDLSGARALLDWLRGDMHLSGGDDPLSGAPFPRLWTKGKDSSEATIKLAAAALLAEFEGTASRSLSVLQAANDANLTESEKQGTTLARAMAYARVRDFSKELVSISELYAQFPESIVAFYNRLYALGVLGRFEESEQMAEERSRRIPGDVDAMRGRANVALWREDYAAAHAIEGRIVAEGKAEPRDLNSLAWYALFTGKVTASDIESALKAAQLSKNPPYILHTLGCVYAEVGKTKESREVLVQAMNALPLDEPDDNYWYAFGRIAEQYGEIPTAESDYKSVKKPKHPEALPGSSYRLAQARLAAMGKPSDTSAK